MSNDDDVFKLLLNNIKTLNDAVIADKNINDNVIREILENTSKLVSIDKQKLTKLINQNQQIIADTFQRISESKKIEIITKDIDYVLAELVIAAYKKHTLRKRYEVLIEGLKWLVITISGAGAIYAIKLLFKVLQILASGDTI